MRETLRLAKIALTENQSMAQPLTGLIALKVLSSGEAKGKNLSSQNAPVDFLPNYAMKLSGGVAEMVTEKMIESTDAEPVAWYWEDATGCFHITLDRSDVVEMAKTVGCAPKPLFAGLCDTSRFFEQPAPSAQVQDVAGLSVWEGWDKSRDFWSETKHRDAVMSAMFRGPWSMEDAATLLGFIERTWSKAPATKLKGNHNAH
jgi:hypothetical protein